MLPLFRLRQKIQTARGRRRVETRYRSSRAASVGARKEDELQQSAPSIVDKQTIGNRDNFRTLKIRERERLSQDRKQQIKVAEGEKLLIGGW